MRWIFLISLFLATLLVRPMAHGQRHMPGWQQKVHYTLDVELDVRSHRLTGFERIEYTNQSPDTLRELYLHLYINAFRRNSLMEQYQRERYRAQGGSLISYVRERYLGEQDVHSILDGGRAPLLFEFDDTILRVHLDRPLLPGGSETLTIEFETKVPWLIRRMGWNNAEGIEFTIAQWYPKMCVYDAEGWHKAYYLGREFYGEFGTYDVAITLPSEYLVGATGRLVNARDIEEMMAKDPADTWSDRLRDTNTVVDSGQVTIDLEKVLTRLSEAFRDSTRSPSRRTWRYHAENVHDFAWSADPDYLYERAECGPVRLHFLYQPEVADQWVKMKEWVCTMMDYMNANVGPFAYSDFTVAQAGDGGMEYPGIVFITGNRGGFSLASVTAHELAHNWFYGMLGNDETTEAWFDEGITSYYTTRLMEHLFGRYAMRAYDHPLKARWYPKEDARVTTFASYEWWARQGFEEKVLTTSDEFSSDRAYQMAAYYKGQIFMFALEYYFGPDRMNGLMRDFFSTWRLHHVSTEDFKRFLEKETGTELDWLFESWLNTTDRCDYGVAGVKGRWISDNGRRVYEATVDLERQGRLAMPVDVYVKLANDSLWSFRIPARSDDPDIDGLERRPLWSPGVTRYALLLELDAEIEWVRIDTSLQLCDVNRLNNRSGWLPPIEWTFQKPVSPPPTLETYVIEHRPSLWFNRPDALRIGYRTKGRWATDDHRITAGVYSGIRSPSPDYEFSYSTPLYGLGRQTSLTLSSHRLEGRSEQRIGLNKRYYNRTWENPPIHDLSAWVSSTGLHDSSYIPRGQSWSTGAVNTIGLSWRMQTKWHTTPVLQASLISSTLASDNDFARVALSYKHPWILRRRAITLWARISAGYATGDVPDQDLFHLSGASPRETFENPFYRSAGTVPARAWQHRGRRRFYYDGDGGLAGYYDANPKGRRMAALNLYLDIGNPLRLLFGIDQPVVSTWTPFVFGGTGLAWNHDSELKRAGDLVLMDAGAGLRYPLAFLPSWWGRHVVRFDFPFWISRPSANGEKRSLAFRWVFGLDREW